MVAIAARTIINLPVSINKLKLRMKISFLKIPTLLVDRFFYSTVRRYRVAIVFFSMKSRRIYHFWRGAHALFHQISYENP
jgi:hypothetical protein